MNMASIKTETPSFEETYLGEMAVDVKEELPEFEENEESIQARIKEEENEESADIGGVRPKINARLEDVKAGLRRNSLAYVMVSRWFTAVPAGASLGLKM